MLLLLLLLSSCCLLLLQPFLSSSLALVFVELSWLNRLAVGVGDALDSSPTIELQSNHRSLLLQPELNPLPADDCCCAELFAAAAAAAGDIFAVVLCGWQTRLACRAH